MTRVIETDAKQTNKPTLTVFGLGLDEAVFGALVSDQGGAEEVRAALQLQTHLTAEVGDLVGEADDPQSGAIRFPFVSGKHNGKTLRTSTPVAEYHLF